MNKQCYFEEGASRQLQLEQCLLELMQLIPYSHVTIVDICRKAGISRKSFYRYFGSKEDCLHALLDRTILNGFAFCFPEQHQPQFSRAVCERFFLYWQNQAPLLDALDRDDLSRLLVARIVDYLYRENRELRPLLILHPDYALEHILFIISGIMGLVFHWHRSGFQTSVAGMAEALSAIVTQ